ncbi:MAG TPA: sigma-70 family RNA polymerase sigma factor [Baekduia sp.]|uniref:RNA polymerase sigma factor n=1 Tax=Baekduia sp. TaxID=2600305 RepID=UPI002D788A5E|nr:sigma-70 family RNA polymerase sigma factor [Baekduia sp.]HET6505919.1 sigma-70 family RNA polymerase sigma factor [Baekduia sp.]
MPGSGPKALSDERLVAALRAGEPGAFDAIHDRYRPLLVRFARRVLAGRQAVAEDVVQEALLRAYRGLLRDDRPIALRPWLYRLTRNCCLDELSRIRTDTVDLAVIEGGALAAPAHLEPAVAAEGRARLRQVIDDLAVLPESQRHALVRRELDGITHAQLARELGMSEPAARSLVHRARGTLAKIEGGRRADCDEVRAELLAAHDARHRPPARALRHLTACPRCREFRVALKAERRALRLLAPAPLLLTVLGAGGGVGVKLGGASKGAAVTAGALAVAGVAGIVGAEQVFGPGDPAPVALSSPALPAHGVAKGVALPRGTAIVRRDVLLRAGARHAPRTLRIGCPAGLAVADLLPPTGARLDVSYVPGTVVGVARSATIRLRLNGAPPAADRRARVGILCKRPDATGSLRWSAQGP